MTSTAEGKARALARVSAFSEVSLPDTEPAVLEPTAAEPEPAPAAEPVEEQPPAPIEEEPSIDLSTLKNLKASELRVLLEEADPEARQEIEQEIEQRVAQKVQTRDREATTAETGRHEAYQQYIDLGTQSYARLEMRANKFKAGDTEAFADEGVMNDIIAYRNGTLATLVKQNEESLKPVRDQYLPDITPEELKALEPVLYDDRRYGTFKQLPVLMELVAARARNEGFEEGLKKGEKSREAKKELAEKIAKIETIKKQAPGVPPNGRSVTEADRSQTLIREMKSIDVTTPEGADEWRRREDEFKRATRARG